jgi:hypothetical protein
MKKIVAIILVLMMFCFIFAGCGTKENSRFVIIDSDVETEDRISTVLYADKQTNVVYWFTKSGYGQTMTVLLNSDGTPVLYDFEKEKIIEKDR